MSVTPASTREVIAAAAVHATGRVILNQCTPALQKAAVVAGQTCLDRPSVMVVGAVGVMVVNELSPKVAPYVQPVAEPVISFAQRYPKTTVVTTFTMCSQLLPYAVTGEPLTVVATGITCTAAVASLASYLLNEKS